MRLNLASKIVCKFLFSPGMFRRVVPTREIGKMHRLLSGLRVLMAAAWPSSTPEPWKVVPFGLIHSLSLNCAMYEVFKVDLFVIPSTQTKPKKQESCGICQHLQLRLNKTHRHNRGIRENDSS
jgi:hypothetical protein